MASPHPASNTVFDPNTAIVTKIRPISVTGANRIITSPSDHHNQATSVAIDVNNTTEADFPASAILDRILSAVVWSSEQSRGNNNNSSNVPLRDIIFGTQTTTTNNNNNQPTTNRAVRQLSSAKPTNGDKAKKGDVSKPSLTGNTEVYRNNAEFVPGGNINSYLEESGEKLLDSYQFNQRQRDAEIDRIYGTGKAGHSVRARMAGTFLENPFAEPFTEQVLGDIAETRTGEHLARQALRRRHMANRLEKDKDFIIERGREVRKELRDLVASQPPKPKPKVEPEGKGSDNFYGNNKSKVVDQVPEAPSLQVNTDANKDIRMTLESPDNKHPTGLGADGRSALVHDLISRLPNEKDDFNRRKGDYEAKLYQHRAAYQGQFGPGTFEPWQKENADMIRGLVYEIIELIMDAYEGRQKNKPGRQQQFKSSGQRYQQKTSGPSGTDGAGGGDTAVAKVDYVARAANIKEEAEQLRLRRQRHLDNEMLEKIAQLEGEKALFEVTRTMIDEIADEEVELMRICQDFTRAATVKVAWGLANPAAAAKGALPENKIFNSLEAMYISILTKTRKC